jgi:hypothetical protein
MLVGALLATGLSLARPALAQEDPGATGPHAPPTLLHTTAIPHLLG